MKLSIIIISHNTQELLAQTIASIPMKSDWELIIVDNASSDDSVKMIKKRYPKVKLIINNNNLGFAKANNQGIAVANGEFIFLLNSDTLVHEQAIDELVRIMQANTDVGIVTGQLLNADGTIQPQGGYLPTLVRVIHWMFFIDDIPGVKRLLKPYQLRDQSLFKQELNLGWVSGTAMMIRRQVLDQVGYLSEEFFMYGEDVEFCMRVKRANWIIVSAPRAKITHLSHKSSGGLPTAAYVGEFKAIKIIFEKKTKLEFILVRAVLKLGALLRMIIFGILQGRKTSYEAYKKAFNLA